MATLKVKICCITTREEANLAIQCGADALGLVGRMPSGPGVVPDTCIEQIARAVPPPVSTFLLTSETKSAAIIAHHRRVHTTAIQLVDRLEGSDYAALRRELPGVKLVQVIHVIDETSVRAAIQIGRYVDAVLLDSGNPDSAIKELGGTGRTHNWALSRSIVESIDTPVFLAGGLNQTNVREAVATVRPFGVDLCSGVRTDGRLDRKKLEAFFEALRA